jgi:hypothetical protein
MKRSAPQISHNFLAALHETVFRDQEDENGDGNVEMGHGAGYVMHHLCGRVSAAFRWRNNMTILKSVMVATVLLVGGSSLAMAQNGPATGGEHPVAGGAAGGGGWYGDAAYSYGWYGGAPYSYGYSGLYGYYPGFYGYYRPYGNRVTVPPNH